MAKSKKKVKYKAMVRQKDGMLKTLEELPENEKFMVGIQLIATIIKQHEDKINAIISAITEWDNGTRKQG